MRLRARRIVAISAVTVAVLVAVALVLVHLPVSRARVFSFAARQLAARYDLDLRAARLDYNLFTRIVSLSDVQLAAIGHEEEPFLTAGRVSVALPWSVFRGIFAFDRIELERARVAMLRKADGTSNLPTSDTPADATRPPLKLDIRALVLRGLDFQYADEVRDLRIDAGDLQASLSPFVPSAPSAARRESVPSAPSAARRESVPSAPSAARRESLPSLPSAPSAAPLSASSAAGPIEIRGGVQVQIGERRIEAQPITGRMGFDGSALSLEDVALATREGTIALNGAIQRVIDRPALQLRFEGTADLARAADWGTLPIALGGTTAIRGTIEGPAAEPTIKVEAKSDAARLGAVERAGLDAAVTVTTTSLVVDRAALTAGAGTVDATARIGFGDDGETEVAASWRDLSTATVLRVMEGEAPAPNIRVASSLTGKLSMTRTPGAPMVLTVENRSAGPSTPQGDLVPLSGTLLLDARDGRWTLKQTHALGALNVDGTVGGRVSSDELAASTIEGALVADSTDVAAASSAIEHLDLDLPAIATDVRGPLHAIVNVSGRLNALQTQASVSSDALVVPGIAPAAVKAELTVTPDRVDVPALTATIGHGTISGNALVDLAGKKLGGTFTVDAPDAGELLTVLPDSARLSGPIAATATLGGSTSAPDVRAELKGHGLTFAGQPIDTLDATTHVTADTVFVDALRLTTGDGSLSGTASYAWEKEAYTADLKGADLAWRGQLGGEAETEVRITQLAFAGSGTVPQPGGAGTVAFTLAGGPAGEIVESGTADIKLNGANATIEARLPSLGADVKSTVLTSAPYTFDATATIGDMDLQPLAGIAGLPRAGILGRLSLTATAHGEASRAVESTEVTANLQRIAATIGDVPVWLTAPAAVSWRKDEVRVAPLELGFGTGTLKAGGTVALTNPSSVPSASSAAAVSVPSASSAAVVSVPSAPSAAAVSVPSASSAAVVSVPSAPSAAVVSASSAWSAAFDGELGELVRAARGVASVPVELSAAGRIAATWQTTGGLDRSTATVSLTGGQVNWAELPPVTALALQAGFDGSTIALSSLTGTWQDGGISGTASVPRAVLDGSAKSSGSAARGHAQIKVTGLTQSAVAPWVSPAALARIVGRVSATLDADILGTDVKDITGALVLDEAQLNLADIEVQQARQTKIGIRDGRVTMDDVSWIAGGGPLALTGAVTLDAPKGAELDLALKGDLDLGLLVAFAPTTWTAGRANLDVAIGGLASDPDVNGRIELQNGEVAVFNPRLILYDLNGTIGLDRQRVRFGGIAGSLNGGSIRLDGQLGLASADRAAAGQLIVELGQVAMEFPEGLQSEINALLTFAPRGDDWQLGGDVRIARSSYKNNISLPALASARRTRPPIAADAEPTFLDRLRLNLFVVTEEDLNVDNNYGRLAGGAAVRVVGTAAEPGLTGRVTMREGGEVYLAGRTFRVERGAISFTSPTRIEPDLDIELRTIANGMDVALTLNGTFDQLKTDVRSTSPDRTDKDAREALYGNLGGEDAATLLSAELLGVTGRAVGLDTLRIERGMDSSEFRNDPTLIVEDINDDASTRLTLSKRLRSDVELIVSRSLRESGNVAATVSYMVRPKIEIRASQRENTDRAIAVRHEITFGGGVTPGGSAATPQPKVSAVRITGEPGRPEAEIRQLLHLEEDDRFAFHQWQRDIDAIKADYTKREYFEARVRPSRQTSEDGQTVTLDYRIDQGRKTTIAIEGHEVHASLLDELRDAWSRAIFDRFLIDDVKARVTRDLLNEGYVGSTIDASIVRPDASTKQLRIVIQAGTHVSGREIRFAGNHGFNHGRLQGVLAAQGLEEEAWLDPSKASTALQAFYREQGYLTAKVTAGAPIVEGNRGVLPVTIEEQPRFAFTEPVLQGVGDARKAAVEQAIAVAIQVGTPYEATLVEDARRRVERFYLTQGFNNARIETRATSDPAAGTVSLAVTVEEGLQQVLREVTTQGDDRTRDGVVRRALRLQEGVPVDLSQWAQARKRLYDTNVFAQVDIEAAPMTPTDEDRAAGIEPVRAVVRLVEYPEWRLRYGLQLNDVRTGDEDDPTTNRQFNLGVLADIQNRNIFGRAVAGGLAARIEKDRQVASLFGSNASFFSLPIRTQAFLFTSRQHERGDVDFLVDRIGTSVEQRWQAYRRTELVYAYRYDQTRTYDPDPNPDDPLPLDNTNHTGKVTTALIVDYRDDPFNATRGWFSSANYEHAARVLGGDSRNSKLLVQQYYFRPVGPMVLASRAQIGAAFGRDPLIRENRFFLGGATTVRGYAEDGLGERGPLGAVGGHAVILLNQELRFPIKGWVKGVGFVDAGNVFQTRGALSFSDLDVGYGFGIRLDTPFAMLRVDFGIPGSTPPGSSRRPNSVRNGRWYIGIGHIF